MAIQERCSLAKHCESHMRISRFKSFKPHEGSDLIFFPPLQPAQYPPSQVLLAGAWEWMLLTYRCLPSTALSDPFSSCLPSSVSSRTSLWKLCSQQQCPCVAVNLHLMKLTNICMKFHHIQSTLYINSFTVIPIIIQRISIVTPSWHETRLSEIQWLSQDCRAEEASETQSSLFLFPSM